MRKSRTKRQAERVGAAFVASAAFCAVVGGALGETSAGAGGGRDAVAVETSADETSWNKATKKEKTPWRSESGGAAFLPPRPEQAPVSLAPKSEPRSLEGLRTVAEILFWALVGAAVLAFVGATIWALRQGALGGVGKDKEKKARQDRERRLEAIAPEARERVDDLGTAAENALAAGDLRLALVYFFSWLIVESDKRGLLRARRGKTNREYWLELAVNPGVRTIYKAAMDAFERVYFGGRTISREEFDDVWRLREPFVAAMERLDAEQAAAERASREAARRATDARISANWASGANNANGGSGGNGAISRIWALPLATAVALGAVASSGCAPKTEYWDETWSDWYAGYAESINGVSIFANYCAEKTRGVERKVGFDLVDGERYETIVWLTWDDNFVVSSDAGDEPVVDEGETEGGESAEAGGAPDSGVDFETLFKLESEPATDAEEEESAEATAAGNDSPKYWPQWDLAFRAARPEIERWLREKPNRTFVFVPGGWSADVDYWRAVQDLAPPEHVAWAAERLRDAEARREEKNVWKEEPGVLGGADWIEPARRRREEERSGEAFWATWDVLDEGKRRERFSGVDAWTAGLPTTTEVWTSLTLTPDVESGTEVLLSVDGDPFVCRRRVGESDFFALESAAFLLNFALTKPENRVLAGRLVDEFEPNGKTLFYVGNRLFFAPEAEKEPVSPFSLARLTPFSLAVLHLAALTAFFVAWRFPILGRPKRNAREATNDYSKHVDGVAFLLEKADARDWARKELETFRAAREAGSAFREPSVDDAEETDGDREENAPTAKKNVSSGRGASRKFFRR
ncbi:MAG: DUF4129 domain-containing protein [Thermoguttaceae bacterium]|nr:DUF4129 domain-containing protein [Thermoguttaceae bacterium]